MRATRSGDAQFPASLNSPLLWNQCLGILSNEPAIRKVSARYGTESRFQSAGLPCGTSSPVSRSDLGIHSGDSGVA